MPRVLGDRFRLGHVVGRSFSIWARTLPLLLPLALVVHIPRVAYGVYLRSRQPDVHDFDSFSLESWLFASIFTRRLLDEITQAPLVVAVWAILNGGRPGYAACVRDGFRAFGPVLRVALVVALLHSILCLAQVLVHVLLARASWEDPASDFANWGTVYLWQAAILAALSPLWVALPAAVLDARPIRRSWALTRGHRIGIFAILLLVHGIGWAATWLRFRVFDLPYAGWLQSLLKVSIVAVLATVGYRALRTEKEGPDAHELHDVFE